MNKDIPITQVEPMQHLVDRARAESRFISLLATLLSVIALVLATSGIYGVLSSLSHSARQRWASVWLSVLRALRCCA